MAAFNRPYTIFCWSTVVNIGLSAKISELFDVAWYHGLEIWVRGHSRSFKPVPFKSLGEVSYWPSIVTMALSCIICERQRDIGRKSWLFHTLFGGSPSEHCHFVWCWKTRMLGLPDSEKTLTIRITF